MIEDIIESYKEIDEEHRLQSTLARKVEFISTTEAIMPFFSPKLDVGCGTGIYSMYFAKLGGDVSAIDLVPAHIERLKTLASKSRLQIKMSVGNAIDLSNFKSNSFDLVLCLGPLYHLVSQENQDECLSECIRVAKTNGVIAFAYISPYSVFPCVIRGDISRMSHELMKKIVDDKKICSNDLCCFWTDSFYYLPEQIEQWLKNSGLTIEDHLATDGQSIAFQSLVNSMDDEEYKIWLDYHRKICRVPSILGTSNHGLVITRKKV